VATAVTESARAVPRPVVNASGESSLRVVIVFPELLGTYGDGGNGQVVAARALWRGIEVELVAATADRPLPSSGDVYLLGGGEDGPEVLAADLLRGRGTASGPLAEAVVRGAAVLAVCAGMQVVGESFPDAGGREHSGLGLLDLTTVKGTGPRAVGEVVADPLPTHPSLPVPLGTLTGFENHSGVTILGSGARPLARVVKGVGNGDRGVEGAIGGRVLATYLHGPVLARNPDLADLLLALATGESFAPLDDTEESALRNERLEAAGRARSRGLRSWRA
jgi:CobQ-like glutamine amidotransferase family enzyme